MNVILRYAPFIVPGLWIIGGALAGFVLDRVVLPRVQTSRLFKEYYWLDIAIGAIRAGVIILCAVAGIYIAILSSHMDPQVEAALDKVLSVLLLAWATFVAAKLVGGAVGHFGRGVDKQMLSASLFSTIAQVAVITLGALIVLSSLGVAITPLLTAFGAGGLAVALALKDTLSNLFSGIQIVASRQIRRGDYVKIENSYEGYVQDINWRNTTIRETRNNLVVIPNEKLAQSVFTNYHLPESEVVTEVSVNVPFESDLERLERAASRAASTVSKRYGGSLSDAKHEVSFRSFVSSDIETSVSIRVPEPGKRGNARHLLIRALRDALLAEGIEPSRAHELNGTVRRDGANGSAVGA